MSFRSVDLKKEYDSRAYCICLSLVIFSFVHLEALALLLKWERSREDNRDMNLYWGATWNARNSFGTIYTRTPIQTGMWQRWRHSLFLSSMFVFAFQIYTRVKPEPGHWSIISIQRQRSGLISSPWQDSQSNMSCRQMRHKGRWWDHWGEGKK